VRVPRMLLGFFTALFVVVVTMMFVVVMLIVVRGLNTGIDYVAGFLNTTAETIGRQSVSTYFPVILPILFAIPVFIILAYALYRRRY